MIQSCAAIIIAAKHGELIKVKDASGVAHTVGTLRCKFEFRTTDWDYTTRTAVFCKGNIATHSKVVNTSIGVLLDGVDECAVPPEVLLPDEKYFSVGVWGVTNDGLRIVSEWLVYRIKDGCYVDSAESFLPTPSVYEQVLAALKNKSDIGHDHNQIYYTKDESDEKYLVEDDLPIVPVQSVNGKTGDVVLTAEDVGAFANSTSNDGVSLPTIPYAAIIDPPDVAGQTAAVLSESQAYTDGEIAKDRTRIDALEAIDHELYIAADTALKTELQGNIETAKEYATSQDAITLAEAQAYADQVEINAVAAAKTETEAQVKALADGAIAINAENIADIIEMLTWGTFGE
jgi:hypothetical protein